MTAIGIDLGTSNSLVSYWTEDGPALIPNVLGSHLTPSIISVDESGEILVGQVAKERLITHPQETVAAFKRHMGTQKTYRLGSYTLSPVELSSFVLQSLKRDAESHLGEDVSKAVISVPAYFNDKQRKATKQAAEMAGLKVERLISEPTAAAIAYGFHQEEEDTKFLVFDLGGGTFDVSILELFEGVMEVKSVAGDNFLGGEDFTSLLMNAFLQSEGLKAEELDPQKLSLLFKQAEECKKALSGNGQSCTMTLKANGRVREMEVDRKRFEKLCQPLMLKLRKPIERALRDADLMVDEIDAIILIGGATRMPIIKSTVSKMFGKLPFLTIHPDEAVALGTAVQVALKERNEAVQELILTDVCPFSLGTAISKQVGYDQYSDGHFFPIIERNTPIPVSRVERLAPIADQQKTITLEVYQGESRMVENNLKLGSLKVDIPPGPAGKEEVDVRYTYDVNGLLEVEVTILSTGEKKNMLIEQSDSGLSDKEMQERMEQLASIKIHPRERTENRLLVARGERLYEEALGDKRSVIARAIEQFEMALGTQDDQLIKRASSEFKEALDQFESWNNL
ncbi:molecular chaperone HscC [Rossellomorea marisflavi]|uniref:Chaperone protein DnaK n=1 Tax=Rossellomorea marisflavi TaxID=189381 RepID=A0A163L3M4_9BACI|nr:molecular chaperone HscC [Rossellomorea marisflavi]KZE48936.1 molecular chaperone HscC [Rossellomorea marisflavi]QHA38134.1 Hsp70 family protein [Rossellomorea marisflavi]TYO74125.1 molecular chaperone HscC [Rossellomorea marisflavi]